MPGPPTGKDRFNRETDSAPGDTRANEEIPDVPLETVLHRDGEVVPPDSHPQTIGRYSVKDLLGAGAFGTVYLAYDAELDRQVAIKVPHSNRVAAPSDLQLYIDEARTVAALEHPGIVPVYDIGQMQDGLCYVVSKYIDGDSLARWIVTEPPSVAEVVDVVATIAETLNFVHSRGIVHRDIKPSNILRDAQGQLFVTDFGMALQDREFGSSQRTGGTPSYMSPEQARGEGHLVDGRSDIFALGVVLYELLAGVRPFRGPSQARVISQILELDPRPLRQLNDQISRELDRICQKSLAKRSSDRFATGNDLAEDLRRCPDVRASLDRASNRRTVTDAPNSEVATSTSRLKTAVVPKGLRAYEGQDAHFFRDMLPGPRDADGLAESIRFWKARIESPSQPDPFRIGVLYGPSGCGKSSFVRAGLLPILSENVVVAIINATPSDTSFRIREAIGRQIGGIDASLPLPRLLSTVRKRDNCDGRKFLIVIDQFEQMLHSATDEEHSEVLLGLRQCDGDHLQCLLLVRDDFWMAVTRFMFELEIELDSSRNLAVVDLFDKPHARKVLRLIGQAYGCVTDAASEDLAAEQTQFIHDAVDALAEDDRVVPIRLSVFAEMIKSRDWRRSTLRELGGVEGVGVRFLEECFDMSSSPADRRIHQPAAQAVLRQMLPDSGVLRGPSQSRSELLAVAGHSERSRDFESLLRLLDSELRLITPIESRPQTTEGAGDVGSDDGTRYQLTHDFLVPAIRQWVTRKQRSTVRGRAELRLTERADVWTAKPEPRQLPSWSEWLPILFWTNRRRWSSMERRMMRAAARRRLLQTLCLMIVVFLLGWGTWHFSGRLRSRELIGQLSTADVDDVPGILEQIDEHGLWAESDLAALAADEQATDRARLFACVAQQNLTSDQTPFIAEQIKTVDFETLSLICRSRVNSSGILVSTLRSELDNPDLTGSEWFRAALAVAAFDESQPRVDNPEWERLASRLADELVSESLLNRHVYSQLVDLATPLRHVVVNRLTETANDRNDAERRSEAIQLLTDLLREEPILLSDVLLAAPPEIVSRILPVIDSQPEGITDLLIANITWDADAPPDPAMSDGATHRRANAGALLTRLKRSDKVWELFRFNPADDTQAYLIHSLSVLGPDNASVLLDRYEHEGDVSARCGLLLAVGDMIEGSTRDRARNLARTAFQEDDDASLHSAAEWLLYQLDDGDWIRAKQGELATREARPHSEWRVTSDGTTMVRLAANEDPRVSAAFEIAATEVTAEQYLRFRPQAQNPNERSPGTDCPANVISWYDAVAYCRWLTAESGLGEEEMCYPPVGENQGEVELHEDYRQRQGYRLPTAAEWEFACQAGAISPFSFGRNEPLRSEYACMEENSEWRAWPAARFKPNPFGLFNMLGNIAEWCSDSTDDRRELRGGSHSGNWDNLVTAISDGAITPTIRFYSIGLRIARSLPETTDE